MIVGMMSETEIELASKNYNDYQQLNFTEKNNRGWLLISNSAGLFKSFI